MEFWNRQNFDGLWAVAEKYRARAGLEGFAEYCRLKERGLRKPALRAVEAFVDATRERPSAEQRAIADELSALAHGNEGIHQLIPHPLRRYLLEVLAAWAGEDPSDPRPPRWLGYLEDDPGWLEGALAIDPGDRVALFHLARARLREVDFQTHHLGESRFIGEPAPAREAAEEAAALAGRLEAGADRDRLLAGADYYRRLVAAWEAYREAGAAEPFPDWCRARGEDFDFRTATYRLRE